jgi:succinyl-CoA synthetase beta subunit
VNIHEYQAKRLLARHGIAVPDGEVARTAQGAEAIARRLGTPVAVKAQVHAGGRGKAGGVKIAGSPSEAGARAAEILAIDISDRPVRQVLVEHAADVKHEYYLAATVDRTRRAVLLVASSRGGMDVEELAAQHPEAVRRVEVDPLLGYRPHHGLLLAGEIGLGGQAAGAFSDLVAGLHQAFVSYDAVLVEVNPLAVAAHGGLVALDAKMIVDDSALYRQPEIAAMRDDEEEPSAERQARAAGLSYVELGGSIGCLVNGAGLAMATMDAVQLAGGQPANFLDIGGGARSDRVKAALGVLLADARVRCVLVNIFGGLTRCDEVARGILAALEDSGAPGAPTPPFVVRMAGTNAEQGQQLLAAAHVQTARTLGEVARLSVARAGPGAGGAARGGGVGEAGGNRGAA